MSPNSPSSHRSLDCGSCTACPGAVAGPDPAAEATPRGALLVAAAALTFLAPVAGALAGVLLVPGGGLAQLGAAAGGFGVTAAVAAGIAPRLARRAASCSPV